jgi:tetratricopeptide (TPR) repeat protein/mRNA-degrading endonuclease toxin of MazEF toxin-antitoxin module
VARVFLSYAHDDDAHVEAVRDLWLFLRGNGVDAQLDLAAADEPQDWPQWMGEQLRTCAYVLVIASPDYKAAAEGELPPDRRRGVRWEAAMIRERLYADLDEGRKRVLSVVLPGRDRAELPDWMRPNTVTVYSVRDLTVPGAEDLLRVVTTQPRETVPPLGPVPLLPARGAAPTRAGLRTEVVIGATLDGGEVEATVSVAGTVLCEQRSRLPREALDVWSGPVTAERLAAAGLALGAALVDGPTRQRLADLVSASQAADWIDVVLASADAAIGLPVELLRLTDQTLPLALLGGVTVRRRVDDGAAAAAPPSPGPVKVLAAVAAPETSELDVEAEMQAVLDAVSELSGAGQARILEVATLSEIKDGLGGSDDYHVLHLSAHGSATTVELEDEDGHAEPVSTADLVGALRDTSARLPLIVLSSCHGGASSTDAMAVGLVRAGARRVLAMQTTVTDPYATALTAAFYRQLSAHPDQPVAQALARARRDVQDRLPKDAPPEWGVATLVTAGDDGPLVDTAAAPAPLALATTAPAGKSVRELPLGELIGRRRELREATRVLRRTKSALEAHGLISGVQLLGIGGIGKTALAGRLIGRLRSDGWTIAVHEGRWNPTALFAAVPGLADLDVDDTVKVGLVAERLASSRLLLVLDDFEQNLTAGGEDFADSTFADILAGWCDAAEHGAIMVTSRYPLPADDLYLVAVPIPPLSSAELRRMFVRLPALRSLSAEDRQLLHRVIGGHPRLIEYVDALLRGKPTRLRDVQRKLRALATANDIDLSRPRSLDRAVTDALTLASADILLDELLDLLSPSQREIIDQLTVSRAEMGQEDLASMLPDLPDLIADVSRLQDLTFLIPGPTILLNPSSREVLLRRAGPELIRHEKSLIMRSRRLSEGRWRYEDLLETARHTAFLGRYGDVSRLIRQALPVLPGSLTRISFLAEVRAMLPRTDLSWMAAIKSEFDIVRLMGDLSGAGRLLDEMRERVDSAVAETPDDQVWQEYRSIVLIDSTDIATLSGDLPLARRLLNEAMRQAQEKVDEDPDGRRWLVRMSVVTDRLADIARADMDLAAAEQHDRASLAITERLAAMDPQNSRWQHDLCVSYHNLGDLAQRRRDFTSAKEYYLSGLTVAELLVAKDPNDSLWQRALAISRTNLGVQALLTEDFPTAEENLRAGLEIRQRLVAMDPNNGEWQRDLSISHSNLGHVARKSDPDLAVQHYRASLRIRQELCAQDPHNKQWRDDLKRVQAWVAELEV